MNIGDEYQGKVKFFGYWRDTFLRLEGPGAAALQRVFVEDWDFATREALNGERYFPDLPARGQHSVQVMESGPDQEPNSIREMYFAAILAAKQRLWIASPYFVPDVGLLDALHLARLRGVDVRLLCVHKGDHFLSYHASRYYFADMLAFDGNCRIDDFASRHGALRYNRRRIVVGRVEDEVAGYVHVQLPGAPHAPSQCCGA